jgi:hypothetical protein
MVERGGAVDGKVVWSMGICGLLIGLLAFRIFDARDQLDHYGVDKTAVGAAFGWLTVLVAVAYVVVAVLAALRRITRLQTAALLLLVPTAICALYVVLLALGHTGKVGFPAGSLVLTGIVGAAAAVIVVVRAASAARN